MNLIKQRHKDITDDTFYISTKDIKIVDHLITIKELQEEINEVKQHG